MKSHEIPQISLVKSIFFGHLTKIRALQVHQKMSQEIEGSRPVELLVAQWNTLEDCLHVENCKTWAKVSVNASVALHILLHTAHSRVCELKTCFERWNLGLPPLAWTGVTMTCWAADGFDHWVWLESSNLSTCETTTLWSFKKATENHHVYNR